MDGLLSFWILSAVFALVGTAIRGVIRPLSWATLAIATLFIAPGKVTEAVNNLRDNVRDNEVKLALPTLPSAPPYSPNASPNGSPDASPSPLAPATATAPVPLEPGQSGSSPITNSNLPAPVLANKGWSTVNTAAYPVVTTADAGAATSEPADRSVTDSRSPASTPATTPSDSAPRTTDPPVSALW